MKKVLKAVVCLCLAFCVMLTLSACGVSLNGEYGLYLIKTDAGEASITIGVEEYAQLETKLQEEGSLTVQENAKYQLGRAYFGTEMKLILEDNNVCKISSLNAEQEQQIQVGTYTKDEEDLVLSIGEDEQLNATIKNGIITLTIGHIKLSFKQTI